MCPIRKDWVIAAGFGSILNLKISKVDRYFITWLESRWDWKRRVLRIRDDYEIVIDERMVSWITGIPVGVYRIPFLNKTDKELGKLFKEYVREKDGGIDYVWLYNKCLWEVQDEMVFLRDFILLSFGCLFCMTKYNFISIKLLALLKSTYFTTPRDWNWCGFLYDWIAGHEKEKGRPSSIILMVSEDRRCAHRPCFFFFL